MIKNPLRTLGVLLGLLAFLADGTAAVRQPVKALYMPLADHYAGVLAHGLYADKMVSADFQLERMTNWNLLRAAFLSNKADMAFIICPEAMAMFREVPEFRWVGLLHRDGNSMIVNTPMAEAMALNPDVTLRKPDGALAELIKQNQKSELDPVYCGVPHPHSTHAVVVYKYLREHGLALGIGRQTDAAMVYGETVPPDESLYYMKRQTSRRRLACMQQSLPWGAISENAGVGQTAWFSKDVLPWPKGHVECIIIVRDEAIRDKRAAIQEVITAIHHAGIRLEVARSTNGSDLASLAVLLRKYIPEHDVEAIEAALTREVNGINYLNLNVDENSIGSLQQIMRLAVEGGILTEAIDLKAFADKTFSVPPIEEEAAP